MKYNNILTKEFLVKEYTKNEKTETQIGEQVGCIDDTVRFYLKKYNIPRRTKREIAIKRIQEQGRTSNFPYSFKKGNKYGYKDGRCSKTYYCKVCGKKINRNTALYKSGLCKSCANKGKLSCHFGKKEDLKHKEKRIQKTIRAVHQFPNKKEKLLDDLLHQILFREYKYVGSGEVILCGFNPDFVNVNGQKKIIELYGDYWHNLPSYKERDERRLIAYNKYGYKTLIIWEHELKNLELLVSKIMEFDL